MRDSPVDAKATAMAAVFGAAIRERRKGLGMRQDQLALATGVGRRFLIELEAGKSSCHLGRSLLVADALGFRFAGMTGDGPASPARHRDDPGLLDLPDLPELLDEVTE